MARSSRLTLILSGIAIAAYIGYRALLPLPDPDRAGTPAAAAMVETLPDFTLEDLAGGERAIASWPGKALVINFWATWCAPCLREIPLLKEFQDNRNGVPVQVVGIAVDHLEAVREFADEMNFNYPVLVGQLEAMNAAARFGVDFFVMPFTVFTDTRERILGVHSGELHAEHLDELRDVLDALATGDIDLEGARERLR